MSLFDDPNETAHADREYRRRLLIRGVRGWLHAKRSPKAIAATMFIGAFIFAVAFALLLTGFGMQSWGGRTFLGVFAAFPVFVGELRIVGALALEGMNLSDCGREFVTFDTVVQRARGKEEASMDETLYSDFGHPFMRAPEVVIWCLLSFGFWLVWDLIRRTPDLIAETYIDAQLLARQPHLANHIACRNWMLEASAACAIYFVCFAVFSAVLAQGAHWFVKSG